MHDTVELEERGYPAVLIATENFVAESVQQARLLGMSHLRIASIPHPIATKSMAEIVALGDMVATHSLKLVSSEASGNERHGS